MSVGILTQYQRNDIDLSGFFSPYEIVTQDAVVSLTGSFVPQSLYSNYTFSLTRNQGGVSNYHVIVSYHLTGTTLNVFQTSAVLGYTPIVCGKTSSQFQIRLAVSNVLINSPPVSTSFTISFKIMCVVIYPYSSMQPIITSPFYTQTSGDMIDYFSQYFSSTNLRSTVTNESIFINISAKSTSRTDYYQFGTKWSTDATATSALNNAILGIRQIIYFDPNKTSTTSELVVHNANNVANVNLSTLILYPLSIPNNTYVSEYIMNIGLTPFPLSSIFPRCEFNFAVVNNANRNITIPYTLTKNTSGTTNYVVMMAYTNSGGDPSTRYNAFEASNAARALFIIDKTSTSFTIIFNKTDCEVWNGAVYWCVIYP